MRQSMARPVAVAQLHETLQSSEDATMPSVARELWDWNTDRIEE